MLFINTRPLERAEALSSALLNSNIDVINFPLLELKEHPFSSELQYLYHQLLDASVIVVVSPTAVEVGMKFLHKCKIELSDLSQIQWIAVGEKTAEELKKYQIESFIPSVETSEGMLQLPILDTLNKGAKVAFWRGEGGRQFMMESLRQNGMDVLNFILYERQLPEESQVQSQQLIAMIQDKKSYIALITSEASWLNWLDVLKTHSDLIDQGQYWVLGDRLFNILNFYKKQQNLDYSIVKLMNLKIESILLHIDEIQGRL